MPRPTLSLEDQTRCMRDLSLLESVAARVSAALLLHPVVAAMLPASHSWRTLESDNVDDVEFLRLGVFDPSVVLVGLGVNLVVAGYTRPRTFDPVVASGRLCARLGLRHSSYVGLFLNGPSSIRANIRRIVNAQFLLDEPSEVEDVTCSPADAWARFVEATDAQKGSPAAERVAATNGPSIEDWFRVYVDDDDFTIRERWVDDACSYIVEYPDKSTRDFTDLASILDAILPVDQRFLICDLPEREVFAAVTAWADRNPDCPDPQFFDCGDERYALIVHEGCRTVVPGCLEGNGHDNDLAELTRRGVIETVWSFTANWNTGAPMTFGYSEDLVSYGNFYYLLARTESGHESNRLGVFERESDARLLAASRFSQAAFYREVEEAFPDADCE